MTYDCPHLSAADGTELTRLLMLVFHNDETASAKWLKDRSEFFNSTPLDLLKRDELGVVRVLSYLRDAAP